MTWETIFDGNVMGDHITVERYVEDDDEGEYPIKVTATDKNPPEMTLPIVEPGSVIIPLPPNEPSKRYEYHYESIDEMYEKFTEESGRTPQFTEELEKSIINN
ncbi:hypothetical protein N5J75_11180 [Pantoea brenneri]|uniref:hypothetical protein n=1 Tax=Pantoea brenneri TaxID=472694 RepID=UPI00244AD935|nr:hypothetical protein [Pantoea brenneri]MDH2123760.1 hypothetical protein [Pantoea brenneri]